MGPEQVGVKRFRLRFWLHGVLFRLSYIRSIASQSRSVTAVAISDTLGDIAVGYRKISHKITFAIDLMEQFFFFCSRSS